VDDWDSMKGNEDAIYQLWRRLEEYLRKHASLAGFIDFLAQRNERVTIIPTKFLKSLSRIVADDGLAIQIYRRPVCQGINKMGQSQF